MRLDILVIDEARWPAMLGAVAAMGLGQPRGAQAEPPSVEQPVRQQTVSLDDVFNFTAPFEGIRFTAYNDNVGVRTIGYGFNLTRKVARILITTLGLNYSEVFTGKIPITQEQARQLFNFDAKNAIEDAKKFIGSNVFETYPMVVQLVLTDMAYNIGYPSLSGFVKFKQALLNKDYSKAAYELKNSRWYSQVGNRAIHHEAAIRALATK